MRRAAGFTLIELMIVMAIIGILASFSLPAYQDYTKRARVTEGLALASDHKTRIAEFVANANVWPTNNASVAIVASTDFMGNSVTRVDIADGIITITFNEHVRAGAQLTLTPTTTYGGITWACVPGVGLQDKWIPSVCRTP